VFETTYIPVEWTELIESIVRKGSTRTLAEFKKQISKGETLFYLFDEFKEQVIKNTLQFALEQKNRLSKKYRTKKVDGFFAAYEKSINNLRQGSDESLENIVTESYEQLLKHTIKNL